MNRRKLLKGVGLTAAATAISAPAIAQSAPTLRWRLTTSFPKSLDTLYGACEMFSKAIADLSEQKFQMNAWLTYGGGLDLLNELHRPYNIHGIPFGNTTAQMGGWFRKEIKTLDDLKGLKFRVAGLAGQVLSKLGVVPQQIAPGDIYTALERGSIDAAE